MAQGIEFTDYPTAEELWRFSERTWREWAAWLGVASTRSGGA